MKIKKLVCIQCPLGCNMKIYLDDNGKITKIEDNRCPRGQDYAKEEILDPKRILTTSVKVTDGELPLASVKTDKPVPKKLIKEIMDEIKKITVKAPVKSGMVIYRDILQTGSNIVATRSVECSKDCKNLTSARKTA